jgi:DHA1 family inner membrane transport protein
MPPSIRGCASTVPAWGPPVADTTVSRALPKAMPWALIAAACLGGFAASSSGTTRAPFLIDMARDFDVPMPLVANLVSLTATAWGISSALGGWLSDRVGRRILLVLAPLALAGAMVLQATAGSFVSLAVWAGLSGAFCGTFMGVSFAEVSSQVEDRQRGRALGWVMSGQSLTLLLGVPLAAAAGELIGWRGWLVCIGVLAALASGALLLTVKPSPRASAAERKASSARTLTPRVWGLLTAGIAERICYGLAIVYFATFLQMTYHLSLGALAIPLAIFAVGNVAGTLLGGQLADKLRDRLVTFAFFMVLSGAAAIVLFWWHPNAETTVAVGFLYVLLNALGRPSLMASLAAVPESVRGTVMGLQGTSASIGWIGAAALGAVMLGMGGFGWFGPLTALLAVAGAVGALFCRRMA